MLSAAFSLLLLVAAEPAERIDAEKVWGVRLEISEENIQRLRKEPRKAVAGRVRVDDQAVTEVLIRLKGRGTFQPIDEKPSFTVLCGKAPVPFGTTKFHLNNSAEDQTYVKEIIGTEIFRNQGIPGPRVGHADVRLNGRRLGLYVLKEGFTEDFLKRHFRGEEGASGILYESGATAHDVDQPLEVEIGEAGMAGERLKWLNTAAKIEDHAKRLEEMSALLDIDTFLKFLAVETAICHWDGYGLSQNNYRLHYGGRPERFRFLPSGMDQIFAKADFPWNPPMSGVVARALLETEAGREKYDRQLAEVVAKGLNAARLRGRVRELNERIGRFLGRSQRVAQVEEAEELAGRVTARIEFLGNNRSASQQKK